MIEYDGIGSANSIDIRRRLDSNELRNPFFLQTLGLTLILAIHQYMFKVSKIGKIWILFWLLRLFHQLLN